MWGISHHLILSLAFSSSHFSFLINLSILLWGVIYACVPEAATTSAPLITLNNRSAPRHLVPHAAAALAADMVFVFLFFCRFELSAVVSASVSDSREETVLGSIPLPSYVISPVEPDDNISRRYAFKVTDL